MTTSDYIAIICTVISLIVGSLFWKKIIICFKNIFLKIKVRIKINKLLISRGCRKCPRKNNIEYHNKGRCQWQNLASFGTQGFEDCICFKKQGENT